MRYFAIWCVLSAMHSVGIDAFKSHNFPCFFYSPTVLLLLLLLLFIIILLTDKDLFLYSLCILSLLNFIEVGVFVSA